MVVGSVLAIGAVHTPVLLGVAAVTLGALIAASKTRGWSTQLRSPPVVLCLGLAAYSALQAVPAPIALLARISPGVADIWGRALLPLSRSVRWGTLSADPGASWQAALRWSVYAAIFWLASLVARRRGAAWGATLIFIASIAAAITTVAHGLVGATHVYGLYEPSFNAAPWHIGPLLNPNNLAGYLNLGGLCGLGLLLRRSTRAPQWVVGLGVAIVLAVEFTAGSRGGTAAFILGLIVFGVSMFRRRAESNRGRATISALVLVSVLLGGISLALLGGTANTREELLDRNVQKLETLAWGARMAADFPVFGIGRGAFESVFPAYQHTPGNVVYTHAENFAIQWFCEWGVPVTLAALGVFAWSFRPSRLRVTRTTVTAALFAGACALTLQNLLDLAFEVPGVCIGLAAALGSALGDASRHKRSRSSGRMNLPIARSIVLGTGLSLIGLAGVFGWHDIGSDRAAARRAYDALDGTRERRSAFREEIAAMMLRHPADPYLPLVGAMAAWRAHDESPIPWLQRSLERATVNGRAHLLLAEVLVGAGALRQGLFELRMAASQDSGLVRSAASLAVAWSRKWDDLQLAVPAGSDGVGALDAIAELLIRPGDATARKACDAEALSREPNHVAAHVREADDLLRALSDPASSERCRVASECEAAVSHHAQAIEAAEPDSSTGPELRALLLVTQGHADDAERLIAATCDRVSDRKNCLFARARIAARLKPADKLTETVKLLSAIGCSSSPECAATMTFAGDLLATRLDWLGSLAAYERAVASEPTPDRWLKLANSASNAGAHIRAAEALEKVAARQPNGGDPELRKRIAHERNMLGSFAP